MKNRVGLGTFPLTKISKSNAQNIVRQFIDKGGFYIDTAPLYGFGVVEETLKGVLKEFSRDKFFIISKCGYVDVEGKSFKTVKRSCKYEDVINECEKSLIRLGVNYLDLYFVHKPDLNVSFSETIEALVKLQNDGKIREIGVSNVNLKQLIEYNSTMKINYIQNRFSLLNRSLDTDFEDYLLEKKIGLVPYHVIDRGLLSDKVFNGLHNLRHGDLSVGLWNSKELESFSNLVKEHLDPIAKRLGISVAQLAISWALAKKYTSFVLVGATNPEHLSSNLEANGIVLPQDVFDEINYWIKHTHIY